MSDKTISRLRKWLFRIEMRVRARFGLDCTGCLQREMDRVAKGAP